MENNRRANVVVKPDPTTNFIKKEGDDRIHLSSVPMAPSSASIMPKVEKKHDRKPLDPLPFYAGHLTKNKRNKNKRWYHSTGTVFIRRGPRDHVRAHYSKRDMVVELYVCRSRGATWLPEPVEQEIFQQLNKGGLNIEPLEDMGFLDFLDNSPEFSYVTGQPHKVVPVRKIQSNLEYEVKIKSGHENEVKPSIP